MRVYRPTPIETEQNDQMRKVVEEARALLEQPVPDTFLGRETYQPFPKESPGTNIGDGNGISLPLPSTDE